MKNKMKKSDKTILWIIIAIIAIIIIACSVAAFYSQQPKEETIKIGAILPLSGDSAIVGVSIQQGIDIAVDEINNLGGINGKNIIVIYEDDHYDNKITVTAVNKLLNVDKIDVGIVPFVHGAKSVMPIFEEHRVPLLVVFDCNNALEPGNYTFCTGFSTEKAGEKMAQFAYEKLNLRNVAVVLHQDEWSEIIAPAFEKRFEQLGGKIVLEEKVVVGENDFRTIINKIKSRNADGLYLPFVPVNTDIFLKQAKELGLNITIMSGDALIQDVIDAAGDAAEGVYFTNIYVEDNEISEHLSKKYREKYGEEAPALPMVSFGYDGISVIRKAIETSKELTGEKIKDALYKVDIMGVGGKINIYQNGLTERIENIFQVKNGTFVLYEG